MHDQDIQEPTLLAIALAVISVVLLVGIAILGILFVSAFGFIWWTFTGIAIVLAGLLLRFRRAANPSPSPATGRQLWFGRIRGWGRLVLIGVLASWLGLIVWLAICPGGREPPAKTDPALIRVITWNIHCGQDDGLPWEQFDWPERKYALEAALHQAGPDILCIQEGRPGQVAFLEQALPAHHRVGVGRDDGRSDIFSLGVVFYELLTGRRPFKAATQAELLEQITSVEVRPLRQVDDTIPRELERICLKALAKRASEPLPDCQRLG